MAELISYETIRAIQRAEKSEVLQPLPKDFFASVRKWLERKREQKDSVSLLELENAKKLIEDIVNRRQKKIVIAALRTVRGELPPSNLSEEEQKLFDKVVSDLKEFKNDINERLFGYSAVVEESIREVKENLNEIKEAEEIDSKEENEEKPIEVKQDVIEDKTPGKQESTISLKILRDLPKFVATDLNYYGPYKNGEIVELPKDVADLLVSRNIAEIV